MSKKSNNHKKSSNNNNKGKSKSSNNGNLKLTKDDFVKTSKHGKPNDVSWYTKNPLLAKLSTFVQQFLPLGRNMNLDQRSMSRNSALPRLDNLPGIFALYWLPVPGVSVDGSSEVSKAAASVFERMREKNFSTNVWDIPDLAGYIYSWANAFLFYGYLTLVHSYLKGYKFMNNYYPKGMSSALNVDRNDLLDHYAEFEMAINIFTHIFIKSRVPKDISIIARWLHMSAQVYKDVDTQDKYQTYVFVPFAVGVYDATTGGYTQKDIGNSATPLTFANLNQVMNDFTNALVYDDDYQIISADIEKYLGSDSWNVNSVESGHVAEPVYNEEMLWQIHNADFVTFDSVVGLLPSQQVIGTNTIFYWNPTFTATANKLGGLEAKKIIDSKNTVMNDKEVIESTRLKVIFNMLTRSSTTTGNSTYNIVKCGSEIITNAKVVFSQDEGVTMSSYNFLQYMGINLVTTGGVTYYGLPLVSASPVVYSDIIFSLFYTNSFNGRPIQMITDYDQGNLTYGLISLIGEVDNYAVVEDSQIIAIHEQSLLSEWNLLIS